MADEFSFLTDSDDERAVQDVLSQAIDHSLLEQIAAINCSSFSTSDNLPSHLETRFRKLKSLPATSAAASRFPISKTKSFTPQSGDDSSINKRHPDSSNSVDFEHVLDLKKRQGKSPPSAGDSDDLSDGIRDQKKETKSSSKRKDLKPKSRTGSSESPSDSVDFGHILDDPDEHSDGKKHQKKFTKSRSRSKPKPSSKRKEMKSKYRSGSPESASDSWSMSSADSESRSVSPPQRGIGCLWCSPKKEKRRQGKENRLSSLSSWGNEYDVDSLKSFSGKEQKKIMKMAMEYEEKINRKAEKIVKLAKQASARMMDVSGLDGERGKHH